MQYDYSLTELLENHELYLNGAIDFYELRRRYHGMYDHQYPYESFYLEEIVVDIEGCGKITAIRTLDRLMDGLKIDNTVVMVKPLWRRLLPW